MITNPSLGEFFETARREFEFLLSEFGFTEQVEPTEFRNPFSLYFANLTTSVRVEGINWGFGTQVMLSRLSPGSVGAPLNVPLWAVVEVRAPNECHHASGQLQQIARDALLLRTHATDVLGGDFSVFPAAMDVVAFHAAEAAKPKPRTLP